MNNSQPISAVPSQYGQSVPSQYGQVAPPPTPVPTLMPKKKSSLGLVIAMIITSLIAALFIGLFVWMYLQWDAAHTDVQGQIDKAVAIAVNEKATELETEFAEREKYPYKTFAGPADYGSLTFEYPKTWSVYVEKDASNGGDYVAYFNPATVPAVSNNTIYALRVTISTKSFDNVVSAYQKNVEKGDLSVSVRELENGSANLYQGTVAKDRRGLVAVIKIRDKTAVIRTDSELFRDDFLRLLGTVKFNS